MNRLFIALEIPEDIRNFIIGEREKICKASVRWEPSEKLHLTLKFIGNFPEDQLENLKNELNFLEMYPCFDLSLTEFGFFFKRRDPRILWLGLTDNNILFDLVDDLNKHLVKFNIPVEEKLFKPHLTLLRVPEDKGTEIKESFRGAKIMTKKFISDQIVLYKSELSPKGSRYTPLKYYKLKKQVRR